MLRITDLKLQLREASELRQIDRLLEEINERQGILVQIERLAEANPMLGHRGCRLGVVYPEITEMQARAIFTAAARCAQDGVTVLPEVMVPLVAYSTEFEAQERIVREVARKVMGEYGIDFEYQVGTMIELPRATLAAGKIAEHADFFSFGTNDPHPEHDRTEPRRRRPIPARLRGPWPHPGRSVSDTRSGWSG